MLVMYPTWASQPLLSLPLVLSAPTHNITISVSDQTLYNTTQTRFRRLEICKGYYLQDLELHDLGAVIVRVDIRRE